jgi:hypothetical protein
VPKLVWRVKLVAELEPGVATETGLARLERGREVGLADLGLRLEEVKRLTATLRAEIVSAQVTAAGERGRRCSACGASLAGEGHYRATFRSLFGDVPVRVRRQLARPCQGAGGPKSFAALDLGGGAVAPELAHVTARYAALAPFGKSPRSCPSRFHSAARRTRARCGTGRGGSARRWCGHSRPRPRGGPRRGRPDPSWSGSTAATCAAGAPGRSATSR